MLYDPRSRYRDSLQLKMPFHWNLPDEHRRQHPTHLGQHIIQSFNTVLHFELRKPARARPAGLIDSSDIVRARRISDVPCARASQIAFISHFLRAQNPTPSYFRKNRQNCRFFLFQEDFISGEDNVQVCLFWYPWTLRVLDVWWMAGSIHPSIRGICLRESSSISWVPEILFSATRRHPSGFSWIWRDDIPMTSPSTR